jgi:uncharacterized membrane protein
MNWIVLSIVNAFFNAVRQLLIKKGAVSVKDCGISGWLSFLNVYIFCGFFFYGISALAYIKLLQKVSVSLAYPLGSLGYIFILILSYLFLGEVIDLKKILGTIIIMLGILMKFNAGSSKNLICKTFMLNDLPTLEKIMKSGSEITGDNPKEIAKEFKKIQCRNQAEYFNDTFIPDFGRLTRFDMPGGFGVSVDSSYEVNNVVTTYTIPFYVRFVVMLRINCRQLIR